MIHRLLGLVLIAVALAAPLAGCPKNDRSGAPTVVTGRYVCPMHPNVTSERPGKCGVCGMDLVAAPPPSALPQPPQAPAPSQGP